MFKLPFVLNQNTSKAMMKRDFLSFIEQHNLCTKKDRLLLAVSGGVDSMVLAQLMYDSGFEIYIAHCNFGLRGDESDLDQKFVQDWCNEKKIKGHFTRFDTNSYTEKYGVSTQMAARELRYEWFWKVVEEFNYTKLVTAHHRDDHIETVFLNLARGTGTKGLNGILTRNDDLIRPMLCFGKDQIVSFAEKEGIKWREDASNDSNKYKRNLLRNKIIPMFNELNVKFKDRMSENIKRFQDSNILLEKFLDQAKAEVLVNDHQLDIKKLMEFETPVLLLNHCLDSKGFSYTQCQHIMDQLQDGISGAKFLSEEHEVLRDRDFLTVRLKEEGSFLANLMIELNSTEVKKYSHEYGKLSSEVLDEVEKQYLKNPDYAYLDYNKLESPLTLRVWKQGDRFVPFGMKNQQKVSDFLINNKVSLFEKEKVCVLLSNKQIVWLVGYRVDSRYGVTDRTTQVLKLNWKANDR